MKRAGVLVAVVAAVGAAFAGWALGSNAFFQPPATIVQFGHIRSIKPVAGGYELQLDPAYWLGGLTAQRAAVESGQSPDTDYFVLDPDHKLLTYQLPANVPATVLTSPSAIKSTRVPISELAQIVKGRNPKHRPLLEHGSQRTLGYWVKTRIDTVVSIDQEYQP